jgi:hypothetical protein
LGEIQKEQTNKKISTGARDAAQATKRISTRKRDADWYEMIRTIIIL